jgi:hypothetical protein
MVAIGLLVLINFLVARHYILKKRKANSPTLSAMKDIVRVYDVLDKMIHHTGAYKTAISKVCLKCKTPYAQMLYDNEVVGEERYNTKFHQLEIDEDVIREVGTISKGQVVAVIVDTLRDNLKKRLYSAEGITYSQSHKIMETDNYVYILVVHYRIAVSDIDNNDFSVILDYNNELREIFEANRKYL